MRKVPQSMIVTLYSLSIVFSILLSPTIPAPLSSESLVHISIEMLLSAILYGVLATVLSFVVVIMVSYVIPEWHEFWNRWRR